MDLEMIKLLSRVCAFCEDKRRAIMDCPFVHFHIRAGIVKHVELQNVAGTLMDQPQEQELGIHVVHNRGMELKNQFGPQS
jgi:hypothetical protein